MDPITLQAALRRQPFHPFRIHMTDGASHDVRHPRLVVLEHGRMALWRGVDRRGYARDLELLDLRHIARIEWLDRDRNDELPLPDVLGMEAIPLRPETLRQRLRAQPFRPFRVFVTDGSQHDVRHPETMIVTRDEVAIVQRFDADGFPRNLTLIDPLHITRVEPLPDDDSGSKRAG